MARCFLALDPGSNLGWALQLPDGRLQYGTKVLGGSWDECEGRRFSRYLQFLHETQQRARMAGSEIEKIWFEDSGGWFPRGRAKAAEVILGLRGVLLCWCVRNDIPYVGVAPATLKKAITGNGRADKEAVVKVMRDRGFRIRKDHEADALGLLLFIGCENDRMANAA